MNYNRNLKIFDENNFLQGYLEFIAANVSLATLSGNLFGKVKRQKL